MNTKKSLTEQTNEVLKSRMSVAKKREALIKLGVTPYEAMVLARTSIPATATRSAQAFTFTFGVEIECVGCRSKFAFMQDGQIKTFGRFIEYKGCYYSNLYHLPYTALDYRRWLYAG